MVIWHILLYDLITYGYFPYPGMKTTQVLDALQNGYCMACLIGCPEPLYEIMRECWKDEVVLRPAFKVLHDKLKILIKPEHPHIYRKCSCENHVYYVIMLTCIGYKNVHNFTKSHGIACVLHLLFYSIMHTSRNNNLTVFIVNLSSMKFNFKTNIVHV